MDRLVSDPLLATKLAATILLTCLVAPVGNATPTYSMTLPPSTEVLLGSNNGVIGGNVGCSTSGAYDTSSLIWTLSGPCTTTAIRIGEADLIRNVILQASLAAIVDGSGNDLGGVFTLFGIVPELGIGDVTLLATGKLLEAFYGPSQLGPQSQALIELDFLVEPLQDLGTIVYWQSNARVAPWDTSGMPWETSIDESDFWNVTGSAYYFFDRNVFLVPEPDTLVLFVLALFGLGLTMLCKPNWRAGNAT
ncbi:MAG TPA: hypothetical protein VIB01_12300 [Steroidobacteraceae bacterium]|jgi:hypothetical protein